MQLTVSIGQRPQVTVNGEDLRRSSGSGHVGKIYNFRKVVGPVPASEAPTGRLWEMGNRTLERQMCSLLALALYLAL